MVLNVIFRVFHIFAFSTPLAPNSKFAYAFTLEWFRKPQSKKKAINCKNLQNLKNRSEFNFRRCEYCRPPLSNMNLILFDVNSNNCLGFERNWFEQQSRRFLGAFMCVFRLQTAIDVFVGKYTFCISSASAQRRI